MKTLILLALLPMAAWAQDDFSKCASGEYIIVIKIQDAASIKSDGKLKPASLAGASGVTASGKKAIIVPAIKWNERKKVKQEKINTWGHELLHVVCGDWHQ